MIKLNFHDHASNENQLSLVTNAIYRRQFERAQPRQGTSD